MVENGRKMFINVVWFIIVNYFGFNDSTTLEYISAIQNSNFYFEFQESEFGSKKRTFSDFVGLEVNSWRKKILSDILIN